jgi:hypothetical protein
MTLTSWTASPHCPAWMSAPFADRIRYTGKHVLRLACSGQSHALVTGDSAGQRFRSLTLRFSMHVELHYGYGRIAWMSM